MTGIRAVAILIAVVMSHPVFAGEPDVYRFRDGGYRVGSHIRSTIALTSKLPFERDFAELAPEQQALVRSQYNDLAAPDVPPWPKDGLQTIFKELIRNLPDFRSRIGHGPIMAVARVNAQGVVETVRVYKTPGPDATLAVSKGLFGTAFSPARRNGAAVAMDFLFDAELEQ